VTHPKGHVPVGVEQKVPRAHPGAPALAVQEELLPPGLAPAHRAGGLRAPTAVQFRYRGPGLLERRYRHGGGVHRLGQPGAPALDDHVPDLGRGSVAVAAVDAALAGGEHGERHAVVAIAAELPMHETAQDAAAPVGDGH
jgi:hypothetical protein